jgi:hypothetical protein
VSDLSVYVRAVLFPREAARLEELFAESEQESLPAFAGTLLAAAINERTEGGLDA